MKKQTNNLNNAHVMRDSIRRVCDIITI